MKRVAAISMAALLSLGGATAIASTAGAQSTSSTTTSDPSVTVTDFSVTLAGLGDLTLTIDPVTHEISNIVVVPLDGITASDPVAVHHGVQIDFILADGTVRSIVVEVEDHHGQVRIEIEDDTDELSDDDHSGDGPPAIADRGRSAEHRNDDKGHQGPGASGTSVPGDATTSAPTPQSDRGATIRSQDADDERPAAAPSAGRSSRNGSRD